MIPRVTIHEVLRHELYFFGQENLIIASKMFINSQDSGKVEWNKVCAQLICTAMVQVGLVPPSVFTLLFCMFFFCPVLSDALLCQDAELAWHFFLPGLTSGYMYYGSAEDMPVKQTVAANTAVAHATSFIQKYVLRVICRIEKNSRFSSSQRVTFSIGFW